MIADFFTKPLQGSLFRKMRDVVLGYKHIEEIDDDGGSSVEERVRNQVKQDKKKEKKDEKKTET